MVCCTSGRLIPGAFLHLAHCCGVADATLKCIASTCFCRLRCSDRCANGILALAAFRCFVHCSGVTHATLRGIASKSIDNIRSLN